jgi:hypothetical protein
MSKRKNRSSAPNIPQATLDRARQQLAGDAVPDEPAEEAVQTEVEATPEPVKAAPVSSSRVAAQRAAGSTRSRASAARRVQTAQAKGGRKELLDTEIVKNRLLHPTRMVTEAQLREEYGYVIRDLRTIAIIAIAMVVLMVVLAQVL